MKRLVIVLAALALALGLASCDYKLGARTPGQTYEIRHKVCQFSYRYSQVDWFNVTEATEGILVQPGTVCEVSVKAITHDGQGNIHAGPWSPPMSIGPDVGCVSCRVVSVDPGYAFGMEIRVRAWRFNNPHYILFDDTLRTSVLGLVALDSGLRAQAEALGF